MAYDRNYYGKSVLETPPISMDHVFRGGTLGISTIELGTLETPTNLRDPL